MYVEFEVENKIRSIRFFYSVSNITPKITLIKDKISFSNSDFPVQRKKINTNNDFWMFLITNDFTYERCSNNKTFQQIMNI